MSLYDKSSIALIPSGFKATTGNLGKVYSVLPANGDGDFTHSRGSTATRVNKDGLIESVAIGEARLDYPLTNGLVGDCPALLLEPSRGNFGRYSEQLFNWQKVRATSADNQTISPDGSQTAGEAIVTTATGSHAIYINQFSSVTSGDDYVVSLFVKKSTTKHVRLEDGYSNYGVIFNFDTEEITTKGNASFSDIGVEKYPNGWYRLSVHFLGSSANHSQPALYILRDSDAASSYTGTDEAVFLWGLQVEAGTYHTSYIKNASTGTTTRSADACNGSGTSADINSEEGVLFAELATLDKDDTSSRRISISDSTANNVIRLTFDVASNRLYAVVYKLGTIWATFTTLSNSEDFNKIALKYKPSDFDFYVNGVKVQQQSSGATFDAGTMSEVAFDNGGGGNLFFGKIKQLIVFNEALSDSELATLTS